MKAKTAVALCGVVGLAILAVGQSNRGALRAQQAVTDPLARIGVVSVKKILRESQRYAAHEKETMVEQDRLNGDLSKMNQEVETEQAKLKTFKTGSQEFLDLYKPMVEKQARLQALQEFYRQSSAVKEKQWNEQLFKEILEATAKISEQKGLALVLERTEPEFPIPTDAFVATVNTHKVIYAKGCVDLTAEVLAAVDRK